MQAARSTLGALVLCAGFAATGTAGPHVDWLDDGVVLLKLGPEYDDAVIETSRAELGELLGAGGEPYAGITVRLLTHDEGARGPISGPIQALRPVWEELTGGRLELDLVPISGLYPTLMLDLQRGTHRYDAAVVAAYFYGDLVAGDHMLPVEPLMASGRFPRWSYDVMPPALRTLYGWGGTGYGVLNDADGQVLYYRRDVLRDPANQVAFKAELGYDLPAPPRTWQQVLDVARFFDGKNWDPRDGQPDHGMVLHLKPGEQGFYHFQSLSAPFAISPGPAVDRHHNVYWFDPADMKPLINSPGHVAALELLQQLNRLGPADQIGWRLPQAWDYFLRGKAVFVFSWGDVGALCQDEARSRIKGNCGVAMLPGSTRYWDLERQEWVEPAEPNRVGNTTGGSWHGVQLAGSANPEAAYSFLALMALPPVSLEVPDGASTGELAAKTNDLIRERLAPHFGDDCYG
ncbi:MAG TPA: extracellular solute-binding protein, partial [Geminicoccaceae bacterium]|nr:extracellular solute-binding protein [Geminicoccaceae bacterium]